MKRTPSRPRGRPVSTTKADIERILTKAAPNGLTCPEISKACGVSLRVTRWHLTDLVMMGLAQSVQATKPNGRTILIYGAPGELVPPPGLKDAPIISKPANAPEDDDSWLALVQVRKPVGQWRADNIPAVRSVFDMGVCA